MTRNLATAALLGLIALGTACSKGADSPTSPSPTNPNSPPFYTAIGASDGIGFGGSSPCLPFAECANGTGYVQSLLRLLRTGGTTVGHRNSSLPGAVLSKAIEDLAASVGRPIDSLAGNFIERQAPFTPTETTLVTIFAGGNDANWIRAAASGGVGGSNPNGFIDQQVLSFGQDYHTLIDGIRSDAKSARIVVLNLPNLGGLPYLAGASLNEKRMAQRISVGMTTTVINPLRTSKGVIVVDLMCEPRLYQAASLSSDGFHPNDTGYSIIAAAVVSATTSSNYPSPQSSCNQMTLVQ